MVSPVPVSIGTGIAPVDGTGIASSVSSGC